MNERTAVAPLAPRAPALSSPVGLRPDRLAVVALAIGLLASPMAIAQPAATAGPAPSASTQAPDFSVAERLLFMAPHLNGLKPPATLNYRYTRSGTLEPGFDDPVTIQLKPKAGGGCCAATGQFLAAERELKLPEVEEAAQNPVVLYFLERDVREMKRLTKGAEYYFRKRLRMAIFQGAQTREVKLPYQGKTITATEIAFAPYLDDPNKARFEKFTGKHYRFYLSEAVPGGVYAMRATVPAPPASGAAALLAEDLIVQGGDRQALDKLPARP